MLNVNLIHTVSGKHHPFTLTAQFQIPSGTLVGVWGASGAGKTTLLRLLAGLDRPTQGFIQWKEQGWFKSHKPRQQMPCQKRSIGFVFQDYALFPHLTVIENLAFAQSKPKDRQQIDQLLALTGLTEWANHYPQALSGGQQQRVALARALIRKPEVLLLDEPFSALDGQNKRMLERELLQWHRSLGLTTLLVSHDMAGICRLADVVIWLEQGHIKAIGPPLQLFGHHTLSSKLQWLGEVIKVENDPPLQVLTILAGQEIWQVLECTRTVHWQVGEQVWISVKASQPLVLPVYQSNADGIL